MHEISTDRMVNLEILYVKSFDEIEDYVKSLNKPPEMIEVEDYQTFRLVKRYMSFNKNLNYRCTIVTIK